jgi:hypothetical protein
MTLYRRNGMLPSRGVPAHTLGYNDLDVLSERPGLSAAELERLDREHIIGLRAATRAD